MNFAVAGFPYAWDDCGMFFHRKRSEAPLGDGSSEGNMELADCVHKRLVKLGRFAQIQICGIQYRCWRCKKLSPAVIYITGPGVDSEVRPIYEDPFVLEYAKEILEKEGNPLADSIKPRYSRTMQQSYLSNGCLYCDALFGNSPLTCAYSGASSFDVLQISVRPMSEWLAFYAFSDKVLW
ncbi:hypothetical protein [Bifidobacterium animalis]|uniref:hypothetical protein n=1 Tax=Bifidobacterium animalis TaxID=28025 RepID=UPI00117BDE33|nr:hypothetical protein [Bifidobacterium animalis]QQQ90876.1 hypothetical protein I5Q88_03435 [Bifidobacterium animalis]UQE62619.1 hypothetical protein M2855_04200 [Bifidobacterium animalis]